MNGYTLPDLSKPLDFSAFLPSLEEIQREQDILNKLYPPRKPTTMDWLAPLVMMAGAIGAGGTESPYGRAMLGGLGGYAGELEKRQELEEKRRKDFEDLIEKLTREKIEAEKYRRQEALQTTSLLQNIEKERIRGLEAEREWYEKTYPSAKQRFDIPRYQEILEELNISLPTTEEITQRVIAPGISPTPIDWGRFKGLPPTLGTTIPELVEKKIRRVPILPEEEL
ncbi:MAG: hypothetical protein AB1567_11910, partial [bacterium]